MSILDDAIREHLELKRAHGADEVELKKLEDEAFGPPGRPDDADPFAEAPTEFLGAALEDGPEPEGGRRMPNITDLQEPPSFPVEEVAEEEPVAEEAVVADVEDSAADAPAEEADPALEHQTIPVPHPEPEQPVEPEPIVDQPTEFFDVEAELQSEEKPSPTDEQLLDSQLSEPRLAPAEPIEPTPSEELEIADEESDEYEDDDFFSEQRLSDELHQALDAPVTDEHEELPEHEPFSVAEPEPAPEPETPPPAPPEEATAIYDVEGEDAEEESGEHNAYEPETGSHDDVLEDTPDFLEDAPEDDDLWFEQRPPKDFDFDD
ncbi:MAG TPA: hypothetical protein VMT37_01160 [Solirubrobacterales bacterium]|nr:hypothetical protein [Solirubrobacterales bacterium]